MNWEIALCKVAIPPNKTEKRLPDILAADLKSILLAASTSKCCLGSKAIFLILPHLYTSTLSSSPTPTGTSKLQIFGIFSSRVFRSVSSF